MEEAGLEAATLSNADLEHDAVRSRPASARG